MAAYRRSIFLVNKPFQIRFCIYVCSWLFILSLLYPSVIWSLFDYFIRYVTLDPLGPELSRLQSTRQEMVTLLVGIQAMFLMATFLMSIFISHRIAGPLHKLKTFFEKGARGEPVESLRFRKGDYFQELADGFNEFQKGQIESAKTHHEKIAEAIAAIDKALPSAAGPARDELQKARQSLQSLADKADPASATGAA